MNAYLFSSISTVSQVRPIGDFRRTETLQTWDTSASFIIIAENSHKAQALFEECIRFQSQDEKPKQIEVRKITGAQFLDQMLTEKGNEPLDWRQIQERALIQVESTAIDSFEQGYWVDVDHAVPREKLSPNIEALQADLSQELSTDLNWSVDKQFLFVLSVFSPPPPPPAFDPEEDLSTSANSQDDVAEKTDPIDVRELYETFPQARDKEAAALIQARNSIVAAWLWRRYAANTHLAANEIQIDPMPQVMGLPDASESSE
jgi:hypothetical protein